MSEKNDNTEIAEATMMNNDALMLLTKAEIDIQISTAKAFPRSMKMFIDKAISMATLTEDIAASCCFALPRGGKMIEGPSVRLAEIVCAAYGNIRSGYRVIGNDAKTVTSQGVCHDLETNNAITVEVKKRITDKKGNTFNEDMQIMTGNAAGAIAYRNAVFKIVPQAMVNAVYEKAKEVARGTAETLIKRRDKALEYFKTIGVKNEQICKVLDIKKIEDIDLDKLQVLSGFRTAIKNGESTAKDIFEPEAADKPKVNEEESRTIAFIESADALQLDVLEKELKKENDLYRYTDKVKEKIKERKAQLKE